VVASPQKISRRFKEVRLTKEWLREHCRQHDLYMTPRLNTVLYLHHKEHRWGTLEQSLI
jgi:dynein assembly factor 1